MIILLAWWLPLICIFVGFGIDFGFAFLTKAQLAKGCDAAALASMLNYGKGQAEATAIGQAKFALNVNGRSQLFASPPRASITYPTSPGGGPPVCSCTASAKIHTFFIGLAGFPTLTIANVSQATRPPVILSLVLDRSESMQNNGGAAQLPSSVDNFVSYFIEGTDQLGEVSFSTLATKDVPITTNFQTPINISLKAMLFAGATYAQGGLIDAQAQITGVSSPPPNFVPVVVFFTDGWANTNQDKLPSPDGVLTNYGGCAPSECQFVNCLDPNTGNALSPATPAPNPYTSVGTCNGTTTFPATAPLLIGTATPPQQVSLTRYNISTEADYRAVQLANTLRASGITVYAIGLGNLANPNAINTTYLQELANDPASDQYNPNEPSGRYEYAETAEGLDTAFQLVASDILLRLTH
jgi:Flp pilus assembly protein TadG